MAAGGELRGRGRGLWPSLCCLRIVWNGGRPRRSVAPVCSRGRVTKGILCSQGRVTGIVQKYTISVCFLCTIGDK